MDCHERARPRGWARQRLLTAAAELFYRDGIAATGIDAIVQQAGVAKKSLYNNFCSKADLVNVYLQARHTDWLALYEARLRQASTPAERLLAVFDAYLDHAAQAGSAGFRGCGQLNAAAELPAQDPQRQLVRANKEAVEAILLDHTCAQWPNQPARAACVARHCAFLLEGAVVRAGLAGDPDSLREARAMAAELLILP